MDMDRKKKILIILGAIFMISLCYRILNPFKQERVAELTYTGERLPSGLNKGADEVDTESTYAAYYVQIDFFLKPTRYSAGVFRNIFQKADVKKEIGAPEQIKPTFRLPEAVASEKEDQREMLNQELSRFKIFGSFESGDGRMLFVERGKDIILVQKGDLIDGKYKVEKITKHAITLKVESFDETVYIELKDL